MNAWTNSSKVSGFEERQPWDGFLPATAELRVDARAAFKGKRVLVSGGGGYIGSALAGAILSLPAAQVILLDHAEHGLYLAEQVLCDGGKTRRVELVVGSVCDPLLVREVFTRFRPHLVFHAAALKHVPLMQANPLAAIETNVLGLEVVARAAAEHSTESLVLLSTDKAVDPVSIMGASKRLAELIVLANLSATRMTAMRLCNVLGSRGSVAPLFTRQIERGHAVTVTHPDAMRYFLSLRATVQLLLTASMQSATAGLFVPRSPSLAKIVDLADFLLARADRSKSRILFTQLRRGERLAEALLSAHETVKGGKADNAALVEVLSPSLKPDSLYSLLDDLRKGLAKRDRTMVLQVLRRAVPEYSPAEGDAAE